jgi:hypothetical protein
VIPRRVHFGPTGDDLDRSGDEQSGDNDHGEYVTHGNPPLYLLKIMPIAPKFCDGHHKIPLFFGLTRKQMRPLALGGCVSSFSTV